MFGVRRNRKGRRGPQSRNTCCSRHPVPVVQFIKTKEVQLSMFPGIVKKSAKIKAASAQTKDLIAERPCKENIY